jgi:hypothetical protein
MIITMLVVLLPAREMRARPDRPYSLPGFKAHQASSQNRAFCAGFLLAAGPDCVIIAPGRKTQAGAIPCGVFIVRGTTEKENCMIRRIAPVAAAFMLWSGLATVSMAAPAALQSGASCGRECLKGFITQYVDDLVAHKPEALPVADNVKFTEDCKVLKLGEGIWKSNNKLTGYRRDILDVPQGTAVSFLVVQENDKPVLYVVRLKVADNKITEIESMAVRGKEEGMLFNTDNLKTASKMMTSEVTESERNNREDLIRIALTYPEGLRIGSFVKADSPMVPDAYRYENGQLMAGPGCTFFQGCDNMKTQMIPTLSEITHRVVAVDEDLGVVVVRMNFGKGSTFQGDGVLDVWHSFKIFGGKMHAAEAYCEIVPAGTKSGWE